MAKAKNLQVLEPGLYYHVYNRATGNEKLFRSNENYRYFLRKYREYIEPVADTHAFCLMPNHFHFLIRIREEAKIVDFLKERSDPSDFKNPTDLSRNITNQFSFFFISYAKSYNKQYGRKGSLFIEAFKRKFIDKQSYLLSVIPYIHLNPVEAGLCKSPEKWEHSSFNHIAEENESFIHSKKVIEFYGGLDEFKKSHLLFRNPESEIFLEEKELSKTENK
jgi:putative transposase